MSLKGKEERLWLKTNMLIEGFNKWNVKIDNLRIELQEVKVTSINSVLKTNNWLENTDNLNI